MISSPGLFKPDKCVRGLAWELDNREDGSVLRWDIYESTGGRNNITRIVPAVGVKLKGTNAAYMIMANGRFNDWYLMHYLKRHHPELSDAWNEYYH